MDNNRTTTPPETINVDGTEYKIPEKFKYQLIAYLMQAWSQLGKPKTVFSDSGDKMMQVLIASYEDLFPEDARERKKEISEHKQVEMSISDQVKKHTGRSLASVPLYFDKMMKVFFKEDKKDRAYYLKLVRKYPMFKMVNRV